ncbi:MAG: hypothetical protein M3355_12140 [Actinomycetota bacterium]|nr:hypothetical protein [Actinomycetota bacterium]
MPFPSPALYPSGTLYPEFYQRPLRLNWKLCDLSGNELASLEQRRSSQTTLRLRPYDIQPAQIVLSNEDLAASDVSPLERIVKGYLSGRIIYTGRVLIPTFDSGQDDAIVIDCVDVMDQLQRSFVKIPSPYAIYGFSRANVDQSQIMLDLVAHARPTSAELTAGVKNLPVHPSLGSRPATVNRERNFEPGKEIGEAIHDLSEVFNGVDYAFTPLDRTDGYMAQLDTWSRRGVDKTASVIFEAGVGQNNVRSIKYEPDGSLATNTATVMGQTEEGLAPPSYTSTQPDSRNLYGIFAEFTGRPDVSTSGTVESHAREIVSVLAFPPGFFELTFPTEASYGEGVFGIPPQVYFDYWLGDVVRVVAKIGAMVLDVEGRVTEITLADSAETGGRVQTSLKLAPSLVASGVT